MTERLEVDDQTVLEGVVNITLDNARTVERFPDLPTQVAGCALDRSGQLLYVRWVPAKQRNPPDTWAEERLKYCHGGGVRPTTTTRRVHIPARSHPFLVRAIEAAMLRHTGVNVLLLMGNQRYDVGTFDVESYMAPTLTLCRRRPTDADPRTNPPDAPVRCPAPDSALEQQYRRLFAAWGIHACYGRMMFELQMARGRAPNGGGCRARGRRKRPPPQR